MVYYKNKVMKLNYILIPLMFWTNFLFGQESNFNKETCILKYDSIISRNIYEVVDEMPEFPTGIDSLLSFIKMNLAWPIDPANFSGVVLISVIVEIDGRLTNPKIVRGIYEPADIEALKLIEKMPKWKVGMCNGEAVPVRIYLPIKFIY